MAQGHTAWGEWTWTGAKVLTLSPGPCLANPLHLNFPTVSALHGIVWLLKSCLRVNDPDEKSSLASGPGEEKCSVSSFLKRVKTSQVREEAICRHINSKCHFLQ